jgi:aminoglycoside phosphotransferase (APT) family kinase protein
LRAASRSLGIRELPSGLGRTLATLHTLAYPVSRSVGVPGDPPIPSPALWLSLTEQGVAAWAAALSRAAPELARLGAKTRPVDPDRLVFSHHDVQPSNVLFDPETGEYALLDWDGAGPIDPGRELASRLYTWHVRDDHLDADAARRTLRAYRAAGGVAVIGEAEAYGGLPDALAYLANQAHASLDDNLPAEMREHSTRETCLLLSDPPSAGLFEQILELASVSEERR